MNSKFQNHHMLSPQTEKPPTKKFQKYLIAIIVALIITRFFAVLALQGFHFDESARKTVIDNQLSGQGITQTHFDVAGVPFYVAADADWSPWPTFYAPSIVWASIFGSSQLSLRIFAEICSITAILVFAIGFSLWFRGSKRRRALLLFAIIGLAIPWLFIQGMIFWNPTLVPLYFAISFLAFSLLINQKKQLAAQITLATIAVFGLILVAYTYKPPIIPAAFLCIAMLIFWWLKKTIPRPAIISLALGAGILVIPFLMFYIGFSGANDRTAALSIFSLSLPEMIGTFFWNLVTMISPIFLFIFGDANPRHSVGIFGMLGPGLIILVVCAICYAFKNKLSASEKSLLKISTLAIALTYIGVATTNEGMPHSLRAISAALPWCIIATIGALHIADSPSKKLKLSALLCFGASIITYVFYYFIFYAPKSGGYFS